MHVYICTQLFIYLYSNIIILGKDYNFVQMCIYTYIYVYTERERERC